MKNLTVPHCRLCYWDRWKVYFLPPTNFWICSFFARVWRRLTSAQVPMQQVESQTWPKQGDNFTNGTFYWNDWEMHQTIIFLVRIAKWKYHQQMQTIMEYSCVVFFFYCENYLDLEVYYIRISSIASFMCT